MNDLQKLSPEDTINLLERYDTLGGNKKPLYDLLRAHINRTSGYSKMAGLITFSNILLIVLTFVSAAFVFSLVGDIILTFSEYILSFFYTFILSRYSFYVYTLVISFFTMYYRYEQDIVKTSWKRFYLLEHYSVVFGCIMLAVAFIDRMFILDAVSVTFPLLLLSGIFGYVAIYHDHWFVATMSVWLLYAAFGFTFGAMPQGYYTGFDSEENLQMCLVISIALVSLFLAFKTGLIDTGSIENANKVNLFENGALFFGTFIGLLSLLILSNETYQGAMKYSLQFAMMLACLVVLFFGTTLHSSIMKSLGGTFLVLWLLDGEVHFLLRFGSESMTGFLFVLLVNLFGFRYYVLHFRDYLIF